jgi:hypothetical protein
MHGIVAKSRIVLLLASVLSGGAFAGPTPGVPSPWNGPWGGGYMAPEPYTPWDSPYLASGFGFDYPSVVNGLTASPPFLPGQGTAGPGIQYLPGGGYILAPGTPPALPSAGSRLGY